MGVTTEYGKTDKGPDSLSHLRPYADETTSYNIIDLTEPYNTSFSILYPSNLF